jgi:anti-sigma B factor antagonist
MSRGMGPNVRVTADSAILTGFGQLMNDPRYVDVAQAAREMLDQGIRRFVLDLQGVRQSGGALLGLLVTITREIRKRGGEVVLANVGRDLERFIESMQMDDYWDIFATVEDARPFLMRGSSEAP